MIKENGKDRRLKSTALQRNNRTPVNNTRMGDVGMQSKMKSAKVINNTVCVVITQFEDHSFKGYVPQFQFEVSGSSIEDIKSKVKSSLNNIQPLRDITSTITFVELD